MNYNQMINFLANPNTNVGHMSSHHNGHQGSRDHYNTTNHTYHDTVRRMSENAPYQKQSNHQLLQRNHSLGSQIGQHYKIEETSPKQTRNRTKFTDEQIEKLEGKFSSKNPRYMKAKFREIKTLTFKPKLSFLRQ